MFGFKKRRILYIEKKIIAGFVSEIFLKFIFLIKYVLQKSDYVPYETTIPSLVYRKLACDRTAFEFDSEKVTMSFGKIKNEVGMWEMEKFEHLKN